MTLQQLCAAMTDEVMINVTSANEVVASFMRSTYASIAATILAGTVSSISISAVGGSVKTVDVTVTLE